MNDLVSVSNFVFDSSLKATLLIGCILTIRPVLRRWVPTQCFHLLWLLVGVRLLVPVAPSSSTSIFNYRRGESIRPEHAASNWIVRKELDPVPVVTRMEATVSSRAPQERAHFRFAPLLAGVWAAGIVAQVLLLASSARRLLRSLAHATRIEDPRLLALAGKCAETVGLRRKVVLLETDALAGPAVIGLWRPRLLLPRGLRARLTDEQIRFVLLHECAHLRRHDLGAMWLLAAARTVHWFNPFVWLAVRAARTDAEVACDETVLASSADDARRAYGETLLTLAQLVRWRQPALPAAGMLESRSALRARLANIGRFSRRTMGRTTFAALVFLTVGLVFAADEQQTPSAQKPAKLNPPPAETIASEETSSPPTIEAVQGAVIEIESKFIETSETTILRMKSPGQGVALLRGAVREGPDLHVLTSNEAAELFSDLNSARGVDLLSAPRVITKSGQRAVIEIIREFRYPTEWERNEEKELWIPKTFETRNCGVTLEVEPLVTADGAITLPLIAQNVEFLGWRDVDSGETFRTVGATRLRFWSKLPGPRYRTEINTLGKRRSLPVFSARKRETTVTMQPGDTVLLAELPETEEVQPFKSPAAARRLIATISARFVEVPRAPAAKLADALNAKPIDLNLVPQVVEFEGFINNGGPIQTTSTNALGQTVVDVITPNSLDGPPIRNASDLTVTNQPISGPHSVSTAMSLSDGKTIVLGDVARDDVQKAERSLRGIVRTGDKPGFIRSPYAPEAGVIDARGFPPGTEIRCPSTQKILRVP